MPFGNCSDSSTPEVLAAHLSARTIDALESSAFLLAEPWLMVGDADVELEQAVSARVEFRGPCSGHLELRCPDSLLAQLAGNMLCLERPPRPLELDAIGELANIICGNVLPFVSDTDAFRLAAPQVRTSRLSSESEPSAAAVSHVMVSGWKMTAVLHLDLGLAGSA